MSIRRFRIDRVVPYAIVLALLLLSSCATHCGLFSYCDIPKDWPVTDTYTVEVNNSDLCVSGARRHSCASKGMYQSGARAVEVHTVDDDEDDYGGEHVATLTVTGSPGDEFTASCFQYNGDKFLGLTEVLIGVEIRDHRGIIVAAHPTHPVTRRSSMFFGC